MRFEVRESIFLAIMALVLLIAGIYLLFVMEYEVIAVFSALLICTSVGLFFHLANSHNPKKLFSIESRKFIASLFLMPGGYVLILLELGFLWSVVLGCLVFMLGGALMIWSVERQAGHEPRLVVERE